jgi:LysM repeat protein
MKLLAVRAIALLFLCSFHSAAFAQTPAGSPMPATESARLDAIMKKIDEQNAKIDMLSQQILKLEQQLSSSRPGVMIGEATPAPATAAPTSASPQPAAASPGSGNSHLVARGETLTSIAKMHNVTVSELQKFNHIENDRKLQIGQTIMIPGSSTPAPSASAPAE